MNSSFQNVFYIITCLDCRLQYVGFTGRQMYRTLVSALPGIDNPISLNTFANYIWAIQIIFLSTLLNILMALYLRGFMQSFTSAKKPFGSFIFRLKHPYVLTLGGTLTSKSSVIIFLLFPSLICNIVFIMFVIQFL